jgi:hypothetical protein
MIRGDAMEELRIERVNCNLCLQETRHEVVAERSHNEPEYDYEGNPIFDVVTTYTMLECRGCGSVTLRKTEEAAGPEIYHEYFYPPPIARRQPIWIKDLSKDFQTLILEIYNALHADSKRLALMGARTLVDLFMNQAIGDIGGFQQKMAKLVEEGYLSTLRVRSSRLF